MKQRKLLIAGNWKMSGTFTSTAELAKGLNNVQVKDTAQMAVFPSFLHIKQVRDTLNTQISVGSQDISTVFEGVAYTGEVSAAQLIDAKCNFVLVGHSERRVLIKETDDVLVSKVQNAIKHSITPIFCIGEVLEEYKKEMGVAVVKAQIKVLIDAIGIESFKDIVIAYEPVWAIGTGLSATPEYAESIHKSIRAFIASYDQNIADKIQILYGGSVKSTTALELMSMSNIDGVLVGGASLDANEFKAIYNAASSI